MKPIQVINIVDNENIIINAGSNNNIKVDDLFEIYSTDGVEIIDPFSGESLGSIEFKKATVYAYQVMPKMTICRNYEKLDILDSFREINSAISKAVRLQDAPLNIRPEEITGDVLQKDKTIRVGDSLKRIIAPVNTDTRSVYNPEEGV